VIYCSKFEWYSFPSSDFPFSFYVLNFEFFDKLSLSWISYSFCHKFDMMLMLFNVFQIQLMCLKIFRRCNLLCIKLISVICLKKKWMKLFISQLKEFPFDLPAHFGLYVFWLFSHSCICSLRFNVNIEYANSNFTEVAKICLEMSWHANVEWHANVLCILIFPLHTSAKNLKKL